MPTCVLAVGALAAGAGCGGDDTMGNPGDDGGDGAPGMEGGRDGGSDRTIPPDTGTDTGQDVTPGDSPIDTGVDAGPPTLGVLTVAKAFVAIFDAAPDSGGTKVYFTGIDAAGNIGVFSVPITGGAASMVATGAPFVAPFGIATSSDGMTLYVTDPGVNAGKDLGQIFSLPAAGGTPAAITSSADLLPRGITVETSGGNDALVFTGIDGTNGMQGVFKMPAAGGAVTTVAEGAPFVDPSGVTADSNGNVFVMDTQAAGSHRGAIIKIPAAGTASVFSTDLFVGYPAGISMTADATQLVVSGLDTAEGPDHVASFPVTGGAPTPYVSTGLAMLSNAAGIHRAANVNVFAFVDSAGDGTDAVYAIK